MESFGPLDQPTLARKLGDITHISPLWRKVCQIFGGPEDRALEWLLKCAVQRGASHYEREFPSDLPPDNDDLSNEELAVALCLGQHPYNSVFIRAAAQLLSSSCINGERLVRMAVMERVEPVLLHIASIASKFDPGAQPWAYVLGHMQSRRVLPSDVLPHWSRFVSQTGVTAFGRGPAIKWIRRREPAE